MSNPYMSPYDLGMSNITSAPAGAAATPGFDWARTIPMWGQAASGLAGGIGGLIMSMRESPESRSARHIWEQAKPGAERLLSQLYYNPVTMQGPGYFSGKTMPWGTMTEHQWAPSKAMGNLFSAYLGRQYGMPTSVGRAMSAQAQAPIRMGDLSGARTSSAWRKAGQTGGPQDFAQAAMGRLAPEGIRQMDIMKGAAELSAFNLWRAQKLGQMIG